MILRRNENLKEIGNKMEKFFRKWTFFLVQNEFYVKSFGICLKGVGPENAVLLDNALKRWMIILGWQHKDF